MSRSFHPPRIAVPERSLPIEFGEILAGKYRVDQLLGTGGMAVVYAGTHVELEAPIAIKLLLPTRALNPEAVRRFLTEARAAAKLKNVNVARISDVGTTDVPGCPDLPFIVMERLDGIDLATLMETRKRIPVDEAVDYIRQASAGLAEAHAQKIIHRDIKPANLFLTRSREGAPVIKVLDFGISKTIAAATGQQERVITADKEVMGSPGYMSPEQVRAEKGIDERTDIWSLGVVLHELMTGRDAFAGDSLHEIFASILHAEPTPLDEDIPAEVRAIVRRCLQKDPARRYQTISELTHALSHAIDRPAGMPAPPSFARLGPLVAVAAAALVVIGGGFAMFARGHGDDATGTPAALSLESALTPAPPQHGGHDAPHTPQPRALPPLPAAASPAVVPIVQHIPVAADTAPPEPVETERPRAARPATRPSTSPPPAPPAATPAATPVASASAAKPPATRKRTEW